MPVREIGENIVEQRKVYCRGMYSIVTNYGYLQIL